MHAQRHGGVEGLDRELVGVDVLLAGRERARRGLAGVRALHLRARAGARHAHERERDARQLRVHVICELFHLRHWKWTI